MKYNNNRLQYVILIIVFVNRRRTTTRCAQDYCEITEFCREIELFLLSETLVLRGEGCATEPRRNDAEDARQQRRRRRVRLTNDGCKRNGPVRLASL